MPQSSTAPIYTIKPNVIEKNKESGTITLEIDADDLPPDTKKIALPNGEIIETSSSEVISIEIESKEFDEKGMLTIVTIDGEGIPIGEFSIKIEDNYTVINAETTWTAISSVLIWIITSAVVLTGAILLIVFLVKRKERTAK